MKHLAIYSQMTPVTELEVLQVKKGDGEWNMHAA